MPTQSKTPLIAVSFSVPELREKAASLAVKLKVSLVTQNHSSCDVILVYTENHLEARQISAETPGPVFVDLSSASLSYRRSRGGGRNQSLARAIGLKKGANPSVFDATAGLGKDSFILASLGCRVQMAERSPVLTALLADGLMRGAEDPEIGCIIKDRLTLLVGDSIEIMRQNSFSFMPDVIYLDPMFPERTKSSLVKKEMRLLRRIVGTDEDAPLLLNTALASQAKRVVVKRPRNAPAIDGPLPSFTLPGKSSRFDVYLMTKTNTRDENEEEEEKQT